MCLTDLCRSSTPRVLPRQASTPLDDDQYDDEQFAIPLLPRVVTIPSVCAGGARTASMRRPRTAEASGRAMQPSASTQPDRVAKSSVKVVDNSKNKLSGLMNISDEDRRLDEEAYEEDRRLDEEAALKKQYQAAARNYQPVLAEASESIVRDFAPTTPAADNNNPAVPRIGRALPYRPKPVVRMPTIAASPVLPPSTTVNYISDWSGVTVSRGNAAGRRSSGTRLAWDIGAEDSS